MIWRWLIDLFVGFVRWVVDWLLPASNTHHLDLSPLVSALGWVQILENFIHIQLVFLFLGTIIFFEAARLIFWVVIRIKGLLLFS